jgi:hypothetical protein
VWHALKEHIRSKVPKSQEELQQCVAEFVKTLTTKIL